MFRQSLAAEWAPLGITVNAISPVSMAKTSEMQRLTHTHTGLCRIRHDFRICKRRGQRMVERMARPYACRQVSRQPNAM